MDGNKPSIKFERYADDTVCHCQGREGAEFLLEILTERSSVCKLSLELIKRRSCIVRTTGDGRIIPTSLLTFRVIRSVPARP